MSIKTPQEYRKKVTKQKTIVLPSGLECVVQSMPALQLFQFTAESKVSGVELEEYIKKNMAKVLLMVLPSSVVSPKISAPPDGAEKRDENILYLDELDALDIVEILNAIVSISGADKEKLDSFEKFPDERHRQGNSPDSQGVQL